MARDVFSGFAVFLDPPKVGVKETLSALAHRGIAVKVISGDNRYVAAHLAQAVGLRADRIMTGEDLSKMTKNGLFASVGSTDLFVEIVVNARAAQQAFEPGHVSPSERTRLMPSSMRSKLDTSLPRCLTPARVTW